ncbi:hypothetical protein EST38_g2755 [Candolleomyces aberdarensis]|uniref:Uncharacterized protein n=1 Tax=Candolleomyces aberdarensis TaxID=2316362 RepID=A0A4Q2DUU7_9AGAR|nr:hypothetical protein EST38_g2755 [Candolleomyces aberdarensis]
MVLIGQPAINYGIKSRRGRLSKADHFAPVESTWKLIAQSHGQSSSTLVDASGRFASTQPSQELELSIA